MPPEFWLKAMMWVSVALGLVAAGGVFWEIRKARRAGKAIPPFYLPFSFLLIGGFILALNFFLDYSPPWLAVLLLSLQAACLVVAMRGFWQLRGH